MVDLQKIVFLDIDGPMIPSYVYLKNLNCSMSDERREFCIYCVLAINRLCEQTDAKIVFNTYHNRHYPTQVGTIRDDAIANGVLERHIHEEWKTEYPNTHNRYDAICNWIRKNGEADWIAIDDADFTDRAGARQILIDPHQGFNIPAFNVAADLFKTKGFVMLV